MTKRMKIIGIIPARYDSSRFLGKPLADINGKPMIQHVWERAGKSKLIDRIIIATDDKRIFDAVISFGGEAVMTSKRHKSGTDRIAEAAKNIKCDIVANIQGDEPFISYKNIDKAVQQLVNDKTLNVSTLAVKIKDEAEINDPNIVKVVIDSKGNALYFSRSRIPFNRNKGNVNYFKHIGLYVYRKSFLMKFVKMKQTRLEKAESLEQLRILENEEKIRVILTKIDSLSVDTPADLYKIKNLI
jgi:3-deoxy-manno-octulosonate cytidylyltransferase (CMP-KDO synthetase)